MKQKEPPTPRHFGVTALVVGAAVPGDLPLDRYGLHEYANAYCNYRVNVFRATASEAELVFSDADAENGDELAVNAVSVAPYFAGFSDGRCGLKQSFHPRARMLCVSEEGRNPM